MPGAPCVGRGATKSADAVRSVPRHHGRAARLVHTGPALVQSCRVRAEGPAMSTQLPFQSGSREPVQRPFPTRGVPGGWHDPWDADPYDAVEAALRHRNALRRQVTEAGVQLELVASARADGRWEAYVGSRDRS